MTARAYIRSHVSALVVTGALVALLAAVLRVGGAASELTGLVCALAGGAALLALVLDYLRERSFYQELAELTATLDRARLMPELLDEPSFEEGRIAFEAISAIARQANDEVAEMRRSVEEYRSYVEAWVHEVKAPLAAAQLALDNLEAEGRSDRAQLSALARSLRRVDGYVEQALFYARSETLEADYLVRRHILRNVCQAALRANADALIQAGITPHLGEGLGREVFTDEKWLEFMLGQLMQNSARYVRVGAAGGPGLWLDACVVGEGSASEAVELTVRDNGCGVSAADVPRVFERGFTGENGRSHSHSTGLGLWLVARLAHKMGLSVRADSRAGEFFSVTLRFSTNRMHYLG